MGGKYCILKSLLISLSQFSLFLTFIAKFYFFTVPSNNKKNHEMIYPFLQQKNDVKFDGFSITLEGKLKEKFLAL